MSDKRKNILEQIANSVLDPVYDKKFEIDDVVEFAACPGHLYLIVGGESPFWELEHFGGPKLPDNYHETCFGVKPPDMSEVIETVLIHPNPMEVLAIMAAEEG